MNALRLWYGLFAVLGMAFAMYWSYGLFVQTQRNSSFETIIIIAIVDLALVGATVIFGFFEFLLLFRFIERVEKDGSMYALRASNGRLVIAAESIKIVKRVAQPFELFGSDKYQVFVFSAAGKYWVSKNIPS